MFKGHRNLILGFNAFLPKTHHIDPNIQDFSRWAQNLPGASGSNLNFADSSTSLNSAGPSNQFTRPPPSMPSYPSQSSSSGSANAGVPAPGSNVAPSIPAVGPSPAVIRGSNVQFNRAVSFVEKIKNRFSNQPETYRSFLSLLHSFHRDQRGIKDVYIQVQQLFRNETDLLEEFSLFLPDNSSSSTTSVQASSISQAASSKVPPSMLPPVGRFPSSSTEVPSRPSTSQVLKRSITPSVTSTASQAPISVSLEKPKRPRPHELYNISKTSDESEFFEKVKKYLGNRQVYSEFLKCLSLFSQDILKLPDLINMIHRFIGGNDDLFSWFKRYINFKDSDMKHLDLQPSASSQNRASASSFAEAQVPELNLSALKRIGCYRLYPRGFRLCKASGRTILCDEVLNDEMLSCASFESEDSGFVSSKKNQYEDALFKCEDERFEMDLILEYNLSTIAVLEPVSRRIETMSTTERDAFRLDHRLNGTSEIIYKKAIKRIYGDKGDDIYEYLQRNPASAVPVVLKRLKAKDEEWRRVQRDWNRVWSEIHIKNYYKALDHQGIDFKVADRKTLTTRSLVNEIQVLKEERRLAQERSLSKPSNTATTSSAPHMSQLLTDEDLLKDLLRLINITIKSSASFSGVDRKSLTRFFSTFVPEFFQINSSGKGSEEVVSGDAGSVARQSTASESEDDGGDCSVDEEIASENVAVGCKFSNNSGVSKSGSKNQNMMMSSSPSGQSSIILYANDPLFAFIRIFMISYERLDRLRQASKQSQNRPFFIEKTNVVAQFLDLHSRQSTMTVDEELSTGRDFYGVLLYLLEQLIEGEIEPGLFEEKVRYMFGTSGYLMFTFDKLLLSLLRQTLSVLNDATCENLIRLYDSWRNRKGPRTSEYSARLAAENILIDSSASASASASSKEKEKDTTQGSASTSCLNANLYRIEFNHFKKQLSIHLVDRLGGGNNSQNLSLNSGNSGSIEEKWSVYVDNFVKLESNAQYLNPQCLPFLKRNKQQQHGGVGVGLKNTLIFYNLECKICINTYKIFYVENTEDFLLKKFRSRPHRSLVSNDGKREKLERALNIKI